jgi:hypothetical protein
MTAPLCAVCGAVVDGAAVCPKCGYRDVRASYFGRETLYEIIFIYGRIIKDDEYSVKQTYFHALSAYTTDPSNLQIIEVTSTGKTYVIVNVTAYFPRQDVLNLGGLSPTAIVHDKSRLVDRDTGEDAEEELAELYKQLDQVEAIENGRERAVAKREAKAAIRALLKKCVLEVNLENKIINFLDKPKNKTVEMLKPILSHDKYETYYKITDKSGTGGLATKTVKLKGWPAVLVASTRVPATDETWAEIVSRFDTISPNTNPKKFRAAVELTAARKGLPNDVLSAKLNLHEFEKIREITAAIKDELLRLKEANITPGNFTPNIFWIPFYAKLGSELPAEVGRHMRDSTRFLTALQMSAAANIFNRPRVLVDGKPSLIVIRKDYGTAKNLYFEGDRAESLITGVPERILLWFDKVFMACWEDIQNLDIKEQKTLDAEKGNTSTPIWVLASHLTDKTREVWPRPLTTDAIQKSYLAELIKAGYVDAQDHPTDRRAKHYRPLVDENTRKKGILDESGMFSLELLREALNELEKIMEYKSVISLHDFNDNPLTVEQLYIKYYAEKPDDSSVIFLGNNEGAEDEPSPETPDSGKTPDNPVNKNGTPEEHHTQEEPPVREVPPTPLPSDEPLIVQEEHRLVEAIREIEAKTGEAVDKKAMREKLPLWNPKHLDDILRVSERDKLIFPPTPGRWRVAI